MNKFAIYQRMRLIRSFEYAVIDAVNRKRVNYPCYLSLGQEAVHAAAAEVLGGFHICTQHRCHGVYLAFGGDPAKLRDELLGRASGTSGGRAGSNCIQNHDGFHMWGHHGLIGENVPLAVGLALGLRQPVVAFFGDGAAEEDYILPTLGFAHKHALPVLFICEDNNLSILTPVKDRRDWDLVAVAKAFGLPATDIENPDPEGLVECLTGLKTNLPALLNVHVQRERWHVGVGFDGGAEAEAFTAYRERLIKSVGEGTLAAADLEIQTKVDAIWAH